MINKIISAIIVITIFLSIFCFCGCSQDENASNADSRVSTQKDVRFSNGDSKIYTQDDITAAEKVVFEQQRDQKLIELCYAGDDTVKSYLGYKKEYDADDVIVITAYYDVDPEENQSAICYVLARKKNKDWRIVDSYF